MEQFLTGVVQPLIVSITAAVVPVLLGLLFALAKKKWGLDIAASTQRQLSDIAAQAVLTVEENAAAALKARAVAWTSQQKHAAAVDTILSRVPTLTKPEADDLVRSALAAIRGVGATGQLGN